MPLDGKGHVDWASADCRFEVARERLRSMSVAKLTFLGSSWLLAVGLGLWVLFDYQTTPGAVRRLPSIGRRTPLCDAIRTGPRL